MLGKLGGKSRVSRMLGKAGYGKNAGGKVASGGGHEHHGGIASALKSVEREMHADGGAPRARLDRKSRASGGRNWIAGATKNKGALHRALHVPEGEKIPAKKLAQGAKSDSPKIRKEVSLAKTLKKMH